MPMAGCHNSRGKFIVTAELKAERKEQERMALELLVLGILPDEKIAEISRLTLEEIKELNAQRTA